MFQLHCVPVRRLSKSQAILAAAMPLLLGGCATPFLHDPSVEAQTAAVSDAWAKVDDSTYFADLRKAHLELQAEEDAALTRSLQATRNRNLASYIAPSEAPNPQLTSPTRGVNALCGDVDKRLSQLVGPIRAPGQDGSACPALSEAYQARMVTWSRLPAIIVNRRASLRAAQADRADAVRQFVEERAKWRKAQAQTSQRASAEPDIPLDCEKIAANPAAGDAAAGLPGYPVAEYRKVVDACGGVTQALTAFTQGGELGTLTGAAPNSIIASVFERQRKAHVESERSAAAVAALEPELKTLQEAIKDSQASASAEFRETLDDLKTALARAPAAAKLVGAEQLAIILQDALKAELATAGKPEAEAAEAPSVTTKRVQAVAELADAGALLADAIRANDPERRTSALMMALAAQRQRVDMLRLDAAREADRLAVLDAELLGAVTELALLSEGRLFLTKAVPTNDGIATLPKSPAREAAQPALNRVGLAWSEGRIPMNLARLRHVYLNRAYRIKAAEKTAENWRGLIKPAIDAMRAGGAAGIPPEVIGNLLSPIGVAAAVGG